MRTWPALLAEVANCHGGDAGYLDDLVSALCAGAADGIKFQPVYADELCSPLHPMHTVFAKLSFPRESWPVLADRVRAAGKQVWFDVYGPDSLAVALSATPDGLKVHAMDFDDLEFIGAVLDTGLPVLLSTGGATLPEIDAVAEKVAGRPACLMVGFQRYPTPMVEANVARLRTLRERTGLSVGYMDHVGRDDEFARLLPCLAVAEGAYVVEKHVYLDDRETAYDAASALSPTELDALAALLGDTRAALGSGSFERSAEEIAYAVSYRKPAVATRYMDVGEIVEPGEFAFVRAEWSEGEQPLYRADLPGAMGRALIRPLDVGETLTREALS